MGTTAFPSLFLSFVLSPPCHPLSPYTPSDLSLVHAFLPGPSSVSPLQTVPPPPPLPQVRATRPCARRRCGCSWRCRRSRGRGAPGP